MFLQAIELDVAIIIGSWLVRLQPLQPVKKSMEQGNKDGSISTTQEAQGRDTGVT